MIIDELVLASLSRDEIFTRQVAPFMNKEYFLEQSYKALFLICDKYFRKYNTTATPDVLRVEIDKLKGINDKLYQDIGSVIDRIEKVSELPDRSWRIDETETFCKDRAIRNALEKSIQIAQGDEKQLSTTSIPDLMRDAVAVCFDSRLGHDYFDDAEMAYEYYTSPDNKIPFDLDILNDITNGGVKRKTLNLLLAGCVARDTLVRIRLRAKLSPVWTEKLVEIGEIKSLLNTHVIEIDSPSGFVPVTEFVEKGMWAGYRCTNIQTGKIIIVNENHLFYTDSGWEYAKDLDVCSILMDSGEYDPCIVEPLDDMVDIVDIQVEHPEHWYYADGFTSHNTHIGKSLGLCHLATGYLNAGYNVLYITFEMAEEEIRKRIDANILNIEMDNLGPGLSREAFLNRVNSIGSRTQGNLKIKEYPTSGASTANIRHYVQELKLKHNFVPDVILVDYLNIVASDRHKSADNSYAYKQSVAEELRGFAREVNATDSDPSKQGCVVWSALQLNRGGLKSSDPDMTDTADSIGIAFTADFTLLLYTNQDLIRANQLVAKQEKNRYKNLNYKKKFIIGVDYSKMRWYEVEQSAANMPSIDDLDDDAHNPSSSKTKKFSKFD